MLVSLSELKIVVFIFKGSRKKTPKFFNYTELRVIALKVMEEAVPTEM